MSSPATSIGGERWLSKRHVAEHFDISIRTVERWITEGCGSRSIGGLRRLRLSDIEAFLAAKDR